MNRLHFPRALFQNRIELFQLRRGEFQFRLQAAANMIANIMGRRWRHVSLVRAGPSQDAAGDATNQKNRGQINDDFVLSKVIHGNMLMRKTESAIATEPGSRSLSV